MPKIHNAPAASGRDNWTTPPDLFARLNGEFGFKLDAAADTENALCDGFMDAKVRDAFETAWEPGPIFCNPPYGRIETPRWLQRGYDEFLRTRLTTVFLVPAATETRWFHNLVAPYAKEVRFIKGRLKFGNVLCKDGTIGEQFATFPSMIVVFGLRKVPQLWGGARMRAWDWRK